MKAKTAAVLIGLIFILIGTLGCIPDSPNNQADRIHNMVHIISGALCLFFGLVLRAYVSSFLKVFGVMYFLLGITGLAAIGITGLGQWLISFLHINPVYNILHIGLAVIIFLAGTLLPRTRPAVAFYSSTAV